MPLGFLSKMVISTSRTLPIAISWFAGWGLFQAYAVAAILHGSWQRPEAFPPEAYTALIYPDLLFIPLYIVTPYLLMRQHWLGALLALLSGGAVMYVAVYLLALAGFQGTLNLTVDTVFLVLNTLAVLQISTRVRRVFRHWQKSQAVASHLPRA